MKTIRPSADNKNNNNTNIYSTSKDLEMDENLQRNASFKSYSTNQSYKEKDLREIGSNKDNNDEDDSNERSIDDEFDGSKRSTLNKNTIKSSRGQPDSFEMRDIRTN